MKSNQIVSMRSVYTLIIAQNPICLGFLLEP